VVSSTVKVRHQAFLEGMLLALEEADPSHLDYLRALGGDGTILGTVKAPEVAEGLSDLIDGYLDYMKRMPAAKKGYLTRRLDSPKPK
jgi:hypothetical protein